MAKARVLGNYRIVVTPNIFISIDIARACERLRDAIRAHVVGFASCEVHFDTADVCSFCGKPWLLTTNVDGDDVESCCEENLKEFMADGEGD